MSDDTKSYTTFRISLASGILGSVGASLGWLLAIAKEAGIWPLIITIGIGALVGIVVEWVRHYVQVAELENKGEKVRSPRRSLVRLAWAAGFGFLGLMAEHLVAHVAAEFLRPFLASLASLLPAGIIIGWTMSLGRRKDENLIILLANGILVGIAIALVSGIIWTIGFGTAPWPALVAWWSAVGISTRLVARHERLGVKFGDPIMAVVLTFVLTFIINLLPVTISAYRWMGPFSSGAMLVRSMAAEIQLSPGLPATFWMEAETRLRQEKAAAGGAKPDSVPAKRNVVGSFVPGDAPVVDIKRAMDYLTSPDTASTAVRLIPWAPGTRDVFFRSWFVMLLFAAGLGAAPGVERRLRPVDYPNSETYRKDLILTVVTVIFLVAACVYGRIGR